MTTAYSGIGDRCPFELASGGMADCPRFEARAIFDRPAGSIATCTHLRCSIARPGPGDGGAATFYARCELRTGDFEADRAFVVPLD